MSEQKKIANLVNMIRQVASDYNMDVKVDGPDTMRSYHLDIGDGSMQIWITFDEDNSDSDQIVNCISFAQYDFGPSEIDGLLDVDWDEFLADTEELKVKPPDKDYGIGFLNVIAWHLGAYGQKTADLENRFDSGWYRIRGTVTTPDGLEARIGHWIQATSSDDAKQQFSELSNGTGRDLKVEQFSAEQPDYGPEDIAEELP